MTHNHRVNRLGNLGRDPVGALEEMTPKRWEDSELYAVDGRIFWTIDDDDIVTLHYEEERENTQA